MMCSTRPSREQYPDDVSFWVAYRKWQAEQVMRVLMARQARERGFGGPHA